MKPKKLIIIGAGPVGLMCALFAIDAGLKVQIIARLSGDNQNCAGLCAGGMLAPTYEFVHEKNPDFVDFAFNSRALWNEIAAKIGIDINPNSLAVAQTSPQIEILHNIRNWAKKRGHNWAISADNTEPAKQKLDLESDGLIDPIRAHELLCQYLKNAGVVFVDANIIKVDNGNIIADIGTFTADKIIIAAGIGAKAFQNQIPELSELVPVRGQLAQLDVKSPFDGAIRMGSKYLLARGEKTIIGATAQRHDDDWRPRAGDLNELFAAPHALEGAFRKENVTHAFCGVRPGTKDNIPIIGQSSAQNIYLACGAYRNGWLLAPQIGKDLVALIVHKSDLLPKCFSPQRFNK